MSKETKHREVSRSGSGGHSSRMVSVIVPVYNTEKYLERCLNSVISQTYQNIEVIIVNDGSTDGSGVICDKFAKADKRVKVINQKNMGASAARNIGISKAKGTYVTFADSDDWLELDAIEYMAQLIEQENVDCVRTSLYRNYPNGEVTSELPFKVGKYSRKNVGTVLPAFVGGKEQCYVYLLLLKKDLLSRVRSFNENLHMMEDTCFYMDIFTNADAIFFSDKRTYHYFESEGSVTRSPERYIRNLKDILLVNAELKGVLGKSGLLTDEIREVMDIEHVRLMSEYAYLAYENTNDGTKGIVSTLRGEKIFRDLAGSISLSRLTFGHRYTVKYLLSGQDVKLNGLFRLRRLVDRLHIFIRAFGRFNRNGIVTSRVYL